MNAKSTYLPFFILLSTLVFSQVGINTNTPNSKTWLHVSEQKGTQPKEYKGIITPRYTTAERDAHFSPSNLENGLLIYNTTQGCYNYWREGSPSYPDRNAMWNILCGNVFVFTKCSYAVLTGTSFSTGLNPIINEAFTGEVRLEYKGGDTASYPSGVPFTVDGLTLTLQSGIINPAGGELVYTVTGTPSTSGNKSATFTFKGQSCTVYYTVRDVPCKNGILTPGSIITDAFVLRGNAVASTTSYPYEVRLTPDANYQSGQMWSKNKVDFNQDFTINIKVLLGNKRDNAGGGDGIAIVFQNSPAGTNAVGSTGGGMGAAGITNGIMLELDSHRNTDEISSGIPAGITHGEIRLSSMPFTNYSSPRALGNLTNNAWHNVVITWNKNTKVLQYTVNGTLAGQATFTNIAATLFGGSSVVHFGFTASTGGAMNEQRVGFNNPCVDLPF